MSTVFLIPCRGSSLLIIKGLSFSMLINYFFHLMCRLSCLVVLVAAVIPSSLFVLDLTQFGDVEKNPGPNSGL